MSSESKRPEKPRPVATSDEAFMEKFQGVIGTYANAINADDPEKADQAAMEALMMAAVEAMEHPTPYLQLAEKASEQLAAGNWEAAETTYRELIAMEDQIGKPGLTTKPFMDLAKLFCLRGRLEDACVCAREATESARRSEISTLLAMALDQQVACSLARGRPEEALVAAEEALRVIEPGKMGDLMRATAYVSRGRAFFGIERMAEVEVDLEAAWAILTSKRLSRIGTGPVVAKARCFELEAELCAWQKRFPDAILKLKQALEQRRQVGERAMELSPYPAAAVARDLERLAEIHRESGDAVAAEEAQQKAAELWKQIHLPQ
jgi:tetratricopeptide (TPR) repeat protein